MKLIQSPAPHIRQSESSITLMLDMVLLLCVLTGMSFFFHGIRALSVVGTAVGVCVLCDMACTMLRGRIPNPRDFSSVVTGLMIGLLMPASISYYVVVTACVFAIVVVKQPFGGTGHNAFNPAAAGFSFAAICWPVQIFLYPMPFDKLEMGGKFMENIGAYVSGTGGQEITTKLFQGAAATLKLGGMPATGLFELSFGNFAGPMGTTQMVVILMCLAYLLFRKTVRWQLPVAFLLTCSLLAWFFGRSGGSGLENVLYEMSAGSVLFGGVFMVTDPVSGPRRDASILLYGLLAGAATMLFRFFGGFEEGVTFAILFANAMVPFLDKWSEQLHQTMRRRYFANKKAKANSEA